VSAPELVREKEQHTIMVREEQTELLLRLRADVETAQGIANHLQATLNTACGAVLVGIVPADSEIVSVEPGRITVLL